jgi:hypothetical protein
MADRKESPGHTSDVAPLRRGFDGHILLPGEDLYDEARRVWNAMVDRQPAIIARCATAADVAAAVRFGTGAGSRDRGALRRP